MLNSLTTIVRSNQNATMIRVGNGGSAIATRVNSLRRVVRTTGISEPYSPETRQGEYKQAIRP